MPAAAILVALRFSAEFNSSERPANQALGFWLSGIVNLLLCIAIAVTIYLSPQLLGNDPAMPTISEVLQASGLIFKGVAIWGFIALVTTILLLMRRFRWLWTVNLIGFLAFLVFVVTPASFLVDSQRQLPLRQLAQTVTEIRQPNEQLVMIGFEKPTLVFYTQQPVTYFLRATSTVEYLQQQAVERPDPSTVLVLGYPKKIVHTGLQPNQYQTISQAGAYQLIRVAKQEFLKVQPYTEWD